MKRLSILFVSIFFLSIVAVAQNKVTLIASDSKGVTLKFTLNDYQLQTVATTKGAANTIKAPNCYPIMQKGMPDVFKMASSIILPNTGSYTTTVISEKHTDLSSVLLAPSKGNIMRNVKPESVPFTYGEGYQRDAFFPSTLVKANDPYIARSIRGCSIDANMIQYNPVKKVLRVYTEMIVRIDFNTLQGVNELTNPKPMDSEFEAIYKRQYLNYNPSKYTAVNESGELLIICYDAFMTDMQPFVTHKQNMGVPTTMVASSTVGTTTTAIKTYINNFYTNPAHNLKYVLLVGDYAQITTTMLNTSGGNGGSDNSYAYLAGNDHYPEIFVGRFSAETVAHVNTMVQRTISYENNPTPGNWITSGLGIASSEGPGDNDERDYTHIRNIRTKLMGYNYTAVAEEYDGNQAGGVDASGDASATNVSNIVNAGVGVITYCGHGDWNMFVSSGFNNTNVDALQNTTKWPFIFSVACVNGNFTSQTCFAEHWLRASYNGSPAGALATVMSTINQPWNPPMKGEDEMVNILTETYTSNIKRTYGGITMNAMMSMLDTYTTDGYETMDTWNIFGDPSVMVRTAEATALTISHSNSTLIGTTSIPVFSPVEGARVSLRKDGVLLGIGTITGGTATIAVDTIRTTGVIEVTGSAYNKSPYHGVIYVIDGSNPFVTMSTVSINDIQGNNNQLADYGDTVLLNVTLKNMGLVVANNVSATLANQGANTSIINNSHVYGTIAASDSTTVNGAFKVAVSASVPDQTTNIYTVNITNGTENWTSYYTLLMNAPILKNQLVTINDAGSANANNALDLDESATLNVPVLNMGHANCGATTVTLSTTSTDVSITTPVVNFTSLNASATQTAAFPVVVSASAPLNSNVQFKIISRCGAYSDTTFFNTKIGAIVEDWETNNFSKYTWANDATYPWTIVSTSPQEGTYCAKSGAISNNQSSTLQITLNVAVADSISFWLKTSCEDDPNDDWDYLMFNIDQTEKARWDGVTNWTRVSYPVTAGNKTFKWIYKKDNEVSAGNDCAWIDFISLPKEQSNIGIETETSAIRYSVYPNPANEVVFVNLLTEKSENYTVSLLDITGKVVSQTTASVSANTPNTVQFSTAELLNGVYFVNLNSTSTQKTIKVIVVR